MTKYICLVKILKEEIAYGTLFRESKPGADAPPVVVRALLLYAGRRIVYTTFGLNVLLTYAGNSMTRHALVECDASIIHEQVLQWR